MFGLFKKKKVESLGDYNHQSHTTVNNQQSILNGVQLNISPCAEKKKLQSIKVLRAAIPTAGLKELKAAVEQGGTLRTNLTTQQAMSYVQQLDELGTKVEIVENIKSEQVVGDQVTLILVQAGSKKMAVIKVIRESVPSLGLKEAKSIADNGGQVITADSQVIDKIANQLEQVGATINIK